MFAIAALVLAAASVLVVAGLLTARGRMPRLLGLGLALDGAPKLAGLIAGLVADLLDTL